MAQRQCTSPLLIQNGQTIELWRIPFDMRAFDEDWLQALLFKHPKLLPAHEIEPVFEELIPVARELPTGAGPVDLVYVTPEGNIVLVETKLWRNPDARRTVVAQLIDYTKEMARWSYSRLLEAVRKSGHTQVEVSAERDGLVDLVREYNEEVEEAEFHDRLTRNLRLGRFLLLIIGDGIREDVEHMTEFLQQTPQLGFTIGLIEIGLYRLDKSKPEPLFVQPRILARTREVTRAVVEIRNHAAETVEVNVSLPTPMEEETSSRNKMTEDQFFERLKERCTNEEITFARWMLEEAPKHGLEIEWGEAGPLFKFTVVPGGKQFTLGQLNRTGKLASFDGFAGFCRKNALPEYIWQDYLDGLASLIPGAFRREFEARSGRRYSTIASGPNPWIHAPRFKDIMPNKDRWFELIDKTIKRVNDELAEREQ